MRLTDDQRALRTAVRDLLARQPDAWPTLCEIGAAGLHIPTEYGGAGATLAETCVVAEELGRTLTPTPLLGSSVLAGTALLASNNTEACARLLPAIAAGRSLAALVITADYVLDGDRADVLLVAKPDGLYEVDLPGVHRTAVTTMDQTRRLAKVDLTDATSHQIGEPDAVAKALDAARIVLAAEQVGGARECLRRTVEYCKQRVQFGRPIGSFQAVKHRLADIHVAVETARSAARAAAIDNSPVKAAVAAIYCGEAFQRAAAEMIQLHGGIAITWEHDAHRYLKRAHSSAHLFDNRMSRLAALTGIG